MSSSNPRGFIPAQNDEERILLRRIQELILAVEHTEASRTTFFLNDREQVLASSVLKKLSIETFAFLGGYEQAERKILCVYANQLPENAFPAQCLQIEMFHTKKDLTHRDYLGAILSLGIKRECIGDIIVNDNAVVYAVNQVVQLLLDELVSVGSCNVTVKKIDSVQENVQNGTMCTASISSLRLDVLLAAMLHQSRGKIASLIKSGVVSINHVATTCVHEDIYKNDIFSVRGYGKFKLCEIGAQSKKGKTFISYFQF